MVLPWVFGGKTTVKLLGALQIRSNSESHRTVDSFNYFVKYLFMIVMKYSFRYWFNYKPFTIVIERFNKPIAFWISLEIQLAFYFVHVCNGESFKSAQNILYYLRP